MHGEEFCFWHSPEHAEEAAQARQLGGQRRRRESTISGVYDFEGLDSVQQVRRVVEIAVVDTFALENSVARNRTLAYLAQVAVNLLEKGELEDRVEALESVMRPRLVERSGQARPGRRRGWPR